MKINKLTYLLIFLFLSMISCKQQGKSDLATTNKQKYVAIWDSLAKYEETANWFKEAKFGIYAHWGVLSVPAYANDWYPRNMQ